MANKTSQKKHELWPCSYLKDQKNKLKRRGQIRAKKQHTLIMTMPIRKIAILHVLLDTDKVKKTIKEEVQNKEDELTKNTLKIYNDTIISRKKT